MTSLEFTIKIKIIITTEKNRSLESKVEKHPITQRQVEDDFRGSIYLGVFSSLAFITEAISVLDSRIFNGNFEKVMVGLITLAQGYLTKECFKDIISKGTGKYYRDNSYYLVNDKNRKPTNKYHK